MVEAIVSGRIANRGKVTGTVLLVPNPSVYPPSQDGVIVVVPFTTPILGPLLSKAAGLVTDIGGVTCHAAIISRELDIPCIVGTKDGTRKLRNGQTVTLDANKGVVYG